MTGTIEAVDPEKAAQFQSIVMRSLEVYLARHGQDNVTPHEVFNGATNALCVLLKQMPDEWRVYVAAQCVRLLLDEAGCRSAAVLEEVDRVRPLARFIESEAMGRA